MTDTRSQLESILFVSNNPLSVKKLAKLIDKPEGDVTIALEQLVELRKDSGVVIIEGSDGYQMATNSENVEIVKSFLNADLREKLTDATIEVLAIIAYRQPIAKSEIEAIRGVNSQYSVRQLLMRGLIEKVPNPHDARGHLYQVTTEFMQHLGLTSTRDLPEFESLVAQIKLPDVPQAKPEPPTSDVTK
jgi:segregation and condensation protein B